MIIGKRAGQSFTFLKPWKSVRSSDGSLDSDPKRAETDLSVSTTEIPAASQSSLPSKQKSRRKMGQPKPFLKETKSSHGNRFINRHKYSTSPSDRPSYLKVKCPILLYFKICSFLKLRASFIYLFLNCSKCFFVAFHLLWSVDGALLNGFIVQLTTLGLQKGSLWST